MLRKKLFRLLIIIILLSCSKNKSPFETQIIIDDNYISNWTNSLGAIVRQWPDTLLSLPLQRTETLRQARQEAIKSLNHMVYSLSISPIHTIQSLCLSNEEINNKIIHIVQDSSKFIYTNYFSDGSIETEALLRTKYLAIIIRSYE